MNMPASGDFCRLLIYLKMQSVWTQIKIWFKTVWHYIDRASEFFFEKAYFEKKLAEDNKSIKITQHAKS